MRYLQLLSDFKQNFLNPLKINLRFLCLNCSFVLKIPRKHHLKEYIYEVSAINRKAVLIMEVLHVTLCKPKYNIMSTYISS